MNQRRLASNSKGLFGALRVVFVAAMFHRDPNVTQTRNPIPQCSTHRLPKHLFHFHRLVDHEQQRQYSISIHPSCDGTLAIFFICLGRNQSSLGNSIETPFFFLFYSCCHSLHFQHSKVFALRCSSTRFNTLSCSWWNCHSLSFVW